MALTFIDRTPPMYESGEINKNTLEQELRGCVNGIRELSNYLAYMREVQNYNLNQQGAVPASGEEGNNG